jgi:UV DNA damage repair endonuclease
MAPLKHRRTTRPSGGDVSSGPETFIHTASAGRSDDLIPIHFHPVGCDYISRYNNCNQNALLENGKTEKSRRGGMHPAQFVTYYFERKPVVTGNEIKSGLQKLCAGGTCLQEMYINETPGRKP